MVSWPVVAAGVAAWMICLLAGGLHLPLMSPFSDARLIYFIGPLCAVITGLCTRTSPLLEDADPTVRRRVMAAAWALCMAVAWGGAAAGLLAIYQVPSAVIVSVTCVNMALALILARVIGPTAGAFAPLVLTALAMFNTGTSANLLFGWLFNPVVPLWAPFTALLGSVVLHGALLRRPRVAA